MKTSHSLARELLALDDLPIFYVASDEALVEPVAFVNSPTNEEGDAIGAPFITLEDDSTL